MTAEPATNGRGTARSFAVLAVLLALCLGISAIGGAVTATSVGTWYQALEKPPFTPPDWVFAPVWTTLYIAMAIACWLVWRSAGPRRARAALTAFAVQLALNLLWSVLFFGCQRIGLALAEIVLLLLAIVATAVLFRRHNRLAAYLLVPYAAWVAFATLLNGALFALNRAPPGS